MQTLWLNPMFIQWIRSGRKRSTVRIGDRKIDPGALEFKSQAERVLVTVTRVDRKTFGELDMEDARDDGFDDFEGFKKILRQIYPDLKEDSVLTVVRFEYRGDF